MQDSGGGVEITLDYLGVITRVLLRGRRREIWLKRRGNITKEAETGVMLLKMEEGAMSHGMQAVIRSWK